MLTALIIEDDSIAAELLRGLLEARGVEVAGQAATFAEAETALRHGDYDAVFLDVQLTDGTGFDLVPAVQPHAAIVFITGRDDHAVRAFEVNAVDYIVKPVTPARLEEALRRIVARGRGPAGRRRRYRAADRVFLRGATARGRFVALEQIVAIVSAENYSQVLLADGERWLVRRTMQSWAEALPPELFFRLHRTTLVNLNRLERVERTPGGATHVRLRGARQSFPVGRTAWPQLRVRLRPAILP